MVLYNDMKNMNTALKGDKMDKIKIRRAEKKDIEGLLRLLGEVLEVHVRIRPDIFIPGTTKYTREELEEIICDENTPVFVAVDTDEYVAGYAFCVLEKQPFTTNMRDIRTLYIDDICVDSKFRKQHIGETLYKHALKFAGKADCYDVTLNVWEGNDAARAFYDKMGMIVKKTQLEYILEE